MINLFKVKDKQKKNAENANGKTPMKKQTAGELCLHKAHTQGMNSFSKPSTFFLLLLLFLCTNKNVAREIKMAKNIETTYDDEHNHAHAPTMSHMDHIDITSNLFFHIEDLKIGHKLPLYFPIKDPSKVPNMISKQEADSIPFSTTKLPQILEYFVFDPRSKQAKAMKETLQHCQFPPTKGETKFCATSLESMLENLTQIFGFGNNFKVLTTTQLKNWTPKLQNYTILDHPREIFAPKMVGCHPLPYPYAVFYCHGQKSDTKLFVLSLEGEMDGVKLDAVGICHMDTSQWDPSHASFRLLGIEPGTSPVCHIFPQDNLVWVSSPSSMLTD